MDSENSWSHLAFAYISEAMAEDAATDHDARIRAPPYVATQSHQPHGVDCPAAQPVLVGRRLVYGVLWREHWGQECCDSTGKEMHIKLLFWKCIQACGSYSLPSLAGHLLIAVCSDIFCFRVDLLSDRWTQFLIVNHSNCLCSLGSIKPTKTTSVWSMPTHAKKTRRAFGKWCKTRSLNWLPLHFGFLGCLCMRAQLKGCGPHWD